MADLARDRPADVGKFAAIRAEHPALARRRPRWARFTWPRRCGSDWSTAFTPWRPAMQVLGGGGYRRLNVEQPGQHIVRVRSRMAATWCWSARRSGCGRASPDQPLRAPRAGEAGRCRRPLLVPDRQVPRLGANREGERADRGGSEVILDARAANARWPNAFGTADPEGGDFRACAAYGPLYG